ncbi:MAG TPA: class I SAM-dependent methyltransferase [Aliidongia sp.]|nr:class I SAM-dependent methyltransferase [Aliidongia sp.]
MAETQQAYRDYAPAYDVLFGPLLQRARRRAVRHANDGPAQKLLEIGVGTGLSLPYYRPDAQITGVDISEEMLAKARERAARLALGGRCRLMLMNAEDMGFADDSFDVVLALFVASTVQNLQHFGAELRRVCKPGGKIVLVNHFSSPSRFGAPLRRQLTRFAGSLGFEPYFPLDRFVSETGLEVKETAPAGVFGRLRMLTATKS